MQDSQPKETLSFEIEISGTYWEKQPEFSVFLNDEQICTGTATGEIQQIKFTRDVVENSENKIIIKLLNKEDSDTVVGEDGTTILYDMLLNIKGIKIDEIDLNPLIWDLSEFVGDDPARPVLKQCVNLGWNGSYILPFTSPFYLWLLENI